MTAWTDADREAAIEEMMGMQRYVEPFLFEGTFEPAELVRLLMSRGLPLRTGDHRDDALVDAYDDQATAARAAFTTFANQTQLGQKRSRVDTYLDYMHSQQMEDAA